MKAIIAIISLLVMHYNQDLNIVYYIALIAFVASVMMIAHTLDNPKNK